MKLIFRINKQCILKSKTYEGTSIIKLLYTPFIFNRMSFAKTSTIIVVITFAELYCSDILPNINPCYFILISLGIPMTIPI